MRPAILLARKHGPAETLQPLLGPVDIREVKTRFRELHQDGTLAELQIWTASSGKVQRKTFPLQASSTPFEDSETSESETTENATLDEADSTDETDEAPSLLPKGKK